MLAVASRRLDEVRSTLVSDVLVAQTVLRLRAFANTDLGAEQLAGPVRERIAWISAEIESLQLLIDRWVAVAGERTRLDTLVNAVDSASVERAHAVAELQALVPSTSTATSSTLADGCSRFHGACRPWPSDWVARRALSSMRKEQALNELYDGIAAAERTAVMLDAEAAQAAEHERTLRALEARVAAANNKLEVAQSARLAVVRAIDGFDEERRAHGIAEDATVEDISDRVDELRQRLAAGQKDLRVSRRSDSTLSSSAPGARKPTPGLGSFAPRSASGVLERPKALLKLCTTRHAARLERHSTLGWSGCYRCSLNCIAACARIRSGATSSIRFGATSGGS